MTDLMTASQLLAHFRESDPILAPSSASAPSEATQLTVRPGLGVIAGCASCMERQGIERSPKSRTCAPGAARSRSLTTPPTARRAETESTAD